MDKDILTTSQTAKLLGVSVRTAQLLIEGGTLTTWKTPGGHRRVYRSDVLAFITRQSTVPFVPSARVVLVAGADRLSALEGSLAAVGGCSVEAFSSAHAASYSIGLRAPAAVIVDMAEEREDRMSFLRYLASHPTLGRTKLIAVGDLSDTSFPAARLQVEVTDPRGLGEVVRAALGDASKPDTQFPTVPQFPLAANENQRLAALERSGLLVTGPEETFDQLTWLASRDLRAPIALVTLLTATHQIFKSRQGLEIPQTPRSWAFCNHTILQRDVFTVSDLARDGRFSSNPAVMDGPHFRFYAGAPVVDSDGFALGSVCVIDYEPRVLDADQQHTLRLLARFASGEVRLQAANRLISGALRT
jgi:excisionase family DNA binding protein